MLTSGSLLCREHLLALPGEAHAETQRRRDAEVTIESAHSCPHDSRGWHLTQTTGRTGVQANLLCSANVENVVFPPTFRRQVMSSQRVVWPRRHARSRITDHGSRITDHGSRITHTRTREQMSEPSRVCDHGLRKRTLSCGAAWTVDRGPWTVDRGPWIVLRDRDRDRDRANSLGLRARCEARACSAGSAALRELFPLRTSASRPRPWRRCRLLPVIPRPGS
jgi:hypothetical protein